MFLVFVFKWEHPGVSVYYHPRVDMPEVQHPVEGLPFVAMKTADNKLVPWLASQTDLLAEDYEIVR